MAQENIRYVQIWSGWLRLSHWLIGCGVLFELASAWTMVHDSIDPLFWYDWHIIVGQLTAIAVLLRVILLFFPGSSHWRSLLPNTTDLQASVQMLKFYVSLARAPLPAWYAHNPLWKPLYLLILVVLSGSVMTGLFQHAPYRVFGYAIDELHILLGAVISAFAVFHIIAVFLHDWKGKGALVSAMIGGCRYFHARQQGLAKNSAFDNSSSVEVSMTELRKKAADDD